MSSSSSSTSKTTGQNVARSGATIKTSIGESQLNLLFHTANTAKRRRQCWQNELSSILDDDYSGVSGAKEIPFEFRCDVPVSNLSLDQYTLIDKHMIPLFASSPRDLLTQQRIDDESLIRASKVVKAIQLDRSHFLGEVNSMIADKIEWLVYKLHEQVQVPLELEERAFLLSSSNNDQIMNNMIEQIMYAMQLNPNIGLLRVSNQMDGISHYIDYVLESSMKNYYTTKYHPRQWKGSDLKNHVPQTHGYNRATEMESSVTVPDGKYNDRGQSWMVYEVEWASPVLCPFRILNCGGNETDFDIDMVVVIG